IIPVFIRDNEPIISHTDFIEGAMQEVTSAYPQETILKPSIRLSHEVKGRVPEAKHKAANELLEHEKTIYYERMAFVIEIPSVTTEIDGNTLSLMVGGVKSYSLDNLYNKSGADQHFKIFIGFQNRVCTNLCIWSDGAMLDLRVKSKGQLIGCIRHLIENYNQQYHAFHLRELCNYSLTEKQFAQLVGKCRMYQHLPAKLKNEIPALLLGDQQMSTVVRDFYRDESFCRNEDGTINLWRLYNLFTGANKSTYIHQFADRSVNAFCFAYNVKQALQHNTPNWYLT
ncbi:MAG TPA: DUF3871 family protein, partial [Chitinophagaceae bacterium]|nr:DUF3871 family protein [Chitinophagaceae bacterium]